MTAGEWYSVYIVSIFQYHQAMGNLSENVLRLRLPKSHTLLYGVGVGIV